MCLQAIYVYKMMIFLRYYSYLLLILVVRFLTSFWVDCIRRDDLWSQSQSSAIFLVIKYISYSLMTNSSALGSSSATWFCKSLIFYRLEEFSSCNYLNSTVNADQFSVIFMMVFLRSSICLAAYSKDCFLFSIQFLSALISDSCYDFTFSNCSPTYVLS